VGDFFPTGRMVTSNTGRSFKIYLLTDDGKAVFIGLVSRAAVGRLLRGDTAIESICKYREKPAGREVAQEPLNFSMKLADPTKLKLEECRKS
jgi:hypothetical protein